MDLATVQFLCQFISQAQCECAKQSANIQQNNGSDFMPHPLICILPDAKPQGCKIERFWGLLVFIKFEKINILSAESTCQSAFAYCLNDKGCNSHVSQSINQ